MLARLDGFVLRTAVKACVLAVALVQAVSAQPAGSYRLPAVHPAPPSSSWAYSTAGNRPIGIAGEPVRIIRSLVPIAIRFHAYAFDDGGAAAPGVPVMFVLPGGLGCTATTDAAGAATCATEVVPGILVPSVRTYRIVTGRNNGFLPASAVGMIVWS